MIFFVLFMLTSCKSNAQERIREKSFDKFISSISWNSFLIRTNYGVSIEIVGDAKKLESYGKEISSYLVASLLDSEKTVTSHLILTKIWDPLVYRIHLRTSSSGNTDLSDLDYEEYLVNNLYWYKFISEDRWSIDEDEKNKIYKYWLSRINECAPDGARSK